MCNLVKRWHFRSAARPARSGQLSSCAAREPDWEPLEIQAVNLGKTVSDETHDSLGLLESNVAE